MFEGIDFNEQNLEWLTMRRMNDMLILKKLEKSTPVNPDYRAMKLAEVKDRIAAVEAALEKKKLAAVEEANGSSGD